MNIGNKHFGASWKNKKEDILTFPNTWLEISGMSLSENYRDYDFKDANEFWHLTQEFENVCIYGEVFNSIDYTEEMAEQDFARFVNEFKHNKTE